MKAKAGILVFLIIFSAAARIQAATNEGYGEDSTALGQFVDSFETSDNISTAVNVIRNATLEVMELNVSVALPNENFTAYTEVDTNNKITVLEDRIEFIQLRRDDEGYVYRDFGVDFWGDFQVDFTVVINDTEAGDADNRWIASSVAFTTYVDDYVGGSPGDDCMFVMIRDNGASDNFYKFSIFGLDGGAVLPGVEDIGGVRAVSNTPLYLTFNRTDDDFYLWIYTDEARTVLDETLTLPNTGMAELLRYTYGVQSIDSSTDGEIWMSGYVADLDLGFGGGGYELNGYFTTVDYLSDPLANGSALVAMINTSIPANTQILVEFSEDNSTWVFNDWDPLVGGFESVDLRALNYSSGYHTRFNLSTSSPLASPRVYQNRLITTIGSGSGPPIPGADVNVTGAWKYYNLTAILNVTGIHDDGNLASTYLVDGDTWNCSEVVGVPGYEVKFNITGIDPAAISLWLVNYVWYDGSASHEVNVELYNYSSGAFVEIGEIPDQLGFEWQNFTIYPLRIPLEFVNSSGVMVGRFYHADAGNINHDIVFDRISLHAFIPTAAAAEESFQFFWIVIAIALMLIGLVLSKMWFEGRDP